MRTIRHLTTLAAGGMLAAAAAMIPQASAVPPPEEAVRVDVLVERPYVTAGDTRPLYLMLRFAARPDATPDDARPPLNLALVLDRSGSMSDAGKIEYLRRAAAFAVDRLSPRDRIAIVEFDDRVTVMTGNRRVEDRDAIKRAIAGLEPRGSTDIGGGLAAGVDEALAGIEAVGSGPVTTRVLLLSDGLANRGMKTPAEFAQFARTARMQGVRISALGLGRDFDEDLMQAVAEHGGGGYHYIEHPNQMARIFAEELDRAFATVARDVTLSFAGSDAVRSAEIVGFTDAAAPRVSMPWADFYGEEERTVLVRLEVEAERPGRLALGTVSLAYVDVAAGAEHRFDRAIEIEVTDDRDLAERSVEHAVTVEAAVVEAERKLADALKAYEAGDYEKAEALNRDNLAVLQTQNQARPDPRLQRKIEALSVEQDQMAAVAAEPSEQAEYLKRSKQRLFAAKSGQRTLSTLKEGDKGLEVERLQRALADAGHYSGPIDGVYDDDVRAGVEAWQRAKGFDADGIAGPKTLEALSLY